MEEWRAVTGKDERVLEDPKKKDDPVCGKKRLCANIASQIRTGMTGMEC